MHPSLATLNYSCFEILVKDICCRVCNTYIRGNDFNKESRELDAPSFCSFFFPFFFFLGSVASLVFNLFFILNFPFLHIVHYHLSLVTLCAEKDTKYKRPAIYDVLKRIKRVIGVKCSPRSQKVQNVLKMIYGVRQKTYPCARFLTSKRFV